MIKLGSVCVPPEGDTISHLVTGLGTAAHTTIQQSDSINRPGKITTQLSQQLSKDQ